jgi:hypothetical protein
MWHSSLLTAPFFNTDKSKILLRNFSAPHVFENRFVTEITEAKTWTDDVEEAVDFFQKKKEAISENIVQLEI